AFPPPRSICVHVRIARAHPSTKGTSRLPCRPARRPGDAGQSGRAHTASPFDHAQNQRLICRTTIIADAPLPAI
ncbi:MAG TPA: hypothetical protein VE690_17860, partial [Rhodopila sp.]|nr:hypothetical protein [Rhodopila sp.]